ncbi:UDP-2,3-diacylglucosamine diphosphatase [Pseudidiomarina gelatinasegens]|jgi:UDP-2,3-diacylglucosamine hydrolase|uniref:UDP-2,3-diacylglucosamine hydrolase n=1 Tax=Pseudidiomarina gelatinasegens TaxID=2487740 RepID=A0A443Z7D1_9GAMM|nr:UDP-2,3-diacylglucosamine diphosphatase [Pseudidiomarina gelatinasegens]RWU12834.1 UDP-2,3-diacylglucosamine diphosphatase [Pseudidiomarina gelatinasegens]
MTTWFISDLHLSPARPDMTALFQRFLQEQASHSEALYILGDLFDAWIGDDDTSDFAATVQAALRQLTNSGVPVYFIAGNRDFLIGRRFSETTGVQVLPEPSIINLYGQQTLILHGDTLCTEDVSYQRFRKVIRHRWIQKFLLALPLKLRMRIAAKLRASSKTQKPLSEAQLHIMDANEHAVREAFVNYDVQRMIHGHTHRPKVHHHRLPNGEMAERIVLGDWYTQGSFLKVTAVESQLITTPLNNDNY